MRICGESNPIRSPTPHAEARGEVKGTAMVWTLALDPDPTSHHPDELLRDRQPQPRASILPRRRGICLLERLEDPVLLLRLDPDPRIPDGEVQHDALDFG